MNENEIKEILLNGENVTLECKRAKSDVPKSVWKTYSAFANTAGGLPDVSAALNLAVQLVVVRYLDTLDDTFRCRYCQSLH